MLLLCFLMPWKGTQDHPIVNLLFALVVGFCTYNFFRSITLDPGTCPKPTSEDELRSVCFNDWNGLPEKLRYTV